MIKQNKRDIYKLAQFTLDEKKKKICSTGPTDLEMASLDFLFFPMIKLVNSGEFALEEK